jgi:hypothetical protein
MSEEARRRLSLPTVALLFVLGCGVATTAADFEPFALPEGSTVVELLEGPRDSVVAFYVEPFPFEVFCAVGIEEDRDEFRRAVAFDAEGRVLWRTKVKGLRILWDAHVQDDGTVVLSALVVERGSRQQVRLRVGPAGMTRLP